jgi:hypothetical protein
MMRRNRRLHRGLAILGTTGILALFACLLAAQTPAKPDADASRSAFLQFYRVLTSPRHKRAPFCGSLPVTIHQSPCIPLSN